MALTSPARITVPERHSATVQFFLLPSLDSPREEFCTSLRKWLEQSLHSPKLGVAFELPLHPQPLEEIIRSQMARPPRRHPRKLSTSADCKALLFSCRCMPPAPQTTVLPL